MRVLLLAGVLLAACSESSGPSAGTFRAQLTGERVGTLSGPSNADVVFSEDFPGPQFSIRMFAIRGDTTVVLGIRCPDDQPPSPGDYQLDASGEQCMGTYGRVFTTPEGAAILLEDLESTSGTLTIRPSDPGQVEGSFGFSGTLVVDGDSKGTVNATGAFSADVL